MFTQKVEKYRPAEIVHDIHFFALQPELEVSSATVTTRSISFFAFPNLFPLGYCAMEETFIWKIMEIMLNLEPIRPN